SATRWGNLLISGHFSTSSRGQILEKKIRDNHQDHHENDEGCEEQEHRAQRFPGGESLDFTESLDGDYQPPNGKDELGDHRGGEEISKGGGRCQARLIECEELIT